jgi:hypothetical protein
MMNDKVVVPYRIFVSYRRDDSPGHVGWLVECLNQLGDGIDIFRDVVAIEPGAGWQDVIKDAVRSCDMFVCVLGPEWFKLLKKKAESGARDVAAEEVRLGLAAGAVTDRIVVPVCVAEAALPANGELPEDLAPLLDYNVLTLRDAQWHANLGPLLTKITSHWAAKKKQWPRSLNQLKGREIAQRWWNLMNPPVMMGRRGGLTGAEMKRDLDEELWCDQSYEAAYTDVGIKPNWFYVRDFIAELERRGAYPPTS